MTLQETPYWWDEAPPEDAAATPIPEKADVVIVGGGYAGLGAAIDLAGSRRRVVILEKDRPGDGASTRNGGITSGNIRWSYTELSEKFGEQAATAVYAEGIEARKDLQDFIDNEKIQCDRQSVGRFTGALNSASFDQMKIDAERLRLKTGITVDVVERHALHSEIGSDKYVGGVVRTDIGGVHPAKLHRRMRDIAISRGVTLCGNAAVTSIRRSARQFTVKTTRGTVSANHVIVATNGYTDAGMPWLRRRLVPVVSEMIATEPISDNLMKSLMPKQRMLGEASQLGYYYRPSPDGSRILLGGRRLDPDPPVARERLRQGLVGIFPDLNGTNLTHHWFGFVAFPMDQLPKLTVHDGVIYAAGFCGSGVVWARWVGKKAAELILSDDRASPSACAQRPFRAIPFYNGKPWFLPAMMAYYRWRDRQSHKQK